MYGQDDFLNLILHFFYIYHCISYFSLNLIGTARRLKDQAQFRG